jgi:methionyl-tRNA formyltransferase
VLRGQVVKLFRARARAGDGAAAGAAAGTVVALDGEGVHVAAGDGGVVVIRELQAPGRKRVTAAQFAAGRGVAVGDVLAPPAVERA